MPLFVISHIDVLLHIIIFKVVIIAGSLCKEAHYFFFNVDPLPRSHMHTHTCTHIQA